MTVDLSTISFRSYQENDIDGPTGSIGAHGSPTTKIALQAIKFRAFQQPPEGELTLAEIRAMSIVPANDNLADAIQLTGTSGSVSGNNTNGTTESANEIAWWGADIPTTWYYWKNTTGVEQLFTVDAVDGDAVFDTYRGPLVYEWPHHSGSLATGFDDVYPNSAEVRYANDASIRGSYDQYGRIHVPDGEIVYLEVGNWNSNPLGFGAFTFNWSTLAYAGPPANDDFANAIVISGTGSMQGTNEWATSDGASDPLVAIEGYGPRSVWYKINPSGSSRSVTVSTSAPSSGVPCIDTVIGLYKGTTLAGLTLIARDDDAGTDNWSLLTSQTLPAGETGYVEVTGYDDRDEGSEGTFTLNWSII